MERASKVDNLRVLGWFMIVLGAIGFVNGGYVQLARAIVSPTTASASLVFSLWFAAAGLLWLVCGVATLKRRSWARIVAIVLMSLNCVALVTRGLIQPFSVAAGVGIAIGLSLNLGLIAVMSRPSVRSAYLA